MKELVFKLVKLVVWVIFLALLVALSWFAYILGTSNEGTVTINLLSYAFILPKWLFPIVALGGLAAFLVGFFLVVSAQFRVSNLNRKLKQQEKELVRLNGLLNT